MSLLARGIVAEPPKPPTAAKVMERIARPREAGARPKKNSFQKIQLKIKKLKIKIGIM
jgi:hypothetical protein